MAPPAHAAKNRFLAQAELVDERMKAFDHKVADMLVSDRDVFAARSTAIMERCDELKAHIIEWPEVEIGTANAVEDLSASVDTLEADFYAASEANADRYRSAVDRQLRAWRSRTDRLRLQSALATMELRDELEDIGHRLTDAREGVLVELRNAADDAKDVVIDLRVDVEEVLVDVRHAVERAAGALTPSSKD